MFHHLFKKKIYSVFTDLFYLVEDQKYFFNLKRCPDSLMLWSLFQSDSYRSYLVHEDLVVTERIDDVKPLGFYIRRLCDGKETYRMQRRASLPGIDVMEM